MRTYHKIKSLVDDEGFLWSLLALVPATLLIGYAPSSIALGIFIAFSIRYIVIKKASFKTKISLVLPILLFLWCCLSYFWSVDTEQTLKGIGRLQALALVPLVSCFLPKISLRTLDRIFRVVTIANLLTGVFFIIIAIVKYLNHNSFSVFTYHNLVEVLDLNAIYVSVLYALSYFYLLSKNEKSKLDYLGLIFLGALIMLLSSKIIIIGFIFGNISYFFWFKGHKTLNPKKAIVAAVVATGILYFTSKEFVDRLLIETSTNLEEVIKKEKFNKVYPWTGTSIRLLQIRILKKQIKENQIFWKGFGLFASKDNLKQQHIEFNTYYGYHSYNYHNQYAQVLAELGIFGLGVLSFMLFYGLKKSAEERHFLMFIAFFLVLMVFITESFLWVQRGLFIFIIIYTVFNKLNFSEFREKKYSEHKEFFK